MARKIRMPKAPKIREPHAHEPKEPHAAHIKPLKEGIKTPKTRLKKPKIKNESVLHPMHAPHKRRKKA